MTATRGPASSKSRRALPCRPETAAGPTCGRVYVSQSLARSRLASVSCRSRHLAARAGSRVLYTNGSRKPLPAGGGARPRWRRGGPDVGQTPSHPGPSSPTFSPQPREGRPRPAQTRPVPRARPSRTRVGAAGRGLGRGRPSWPPLHQLHQPGSLGQAAPPVTPELDVSGTRGVGRKDLPDAPRTRNSSDPGGPEGEGRHSPSLSRN